MENNIILDKSKAFAVRIIKFYQYLCDEKKEFVLSKQLLRSGTSIGANARESKNAQSNDSSAYRAPSRPEPSAAGEGFMNIPDGIDEELPFN